MTSASSRALRPGFYALALFSAFAFAAPRAAAADFSLVSLDPASGSLAPVPGGAAATPAAFAAGNVVKVVVACDLPPVDIPVARAITVGYAAVPSAPPAGRALPHLVQAPAACKPPSIGAPASPVQVPVAFGFSCPANAIAQTQIARVRLTLQNTQLIPGPARTIETPGAFVVKCPQPVAHIPFDPGLAVAPSAKATPPPTKKP